MRPFKAALVGLLGEEVPEWVRGALRDEGIDFVQHECHNREELEQYAAEADLVWVWGSRVISGDRLDCLKKCGAILRTGTGTDNVPEVEATAMNILVTNTPEAVAEEVSDHAIALLFSVIRQTAAQDALVRAGVWERRIHKTRWHLRGSTLGVLGFGHIARLLVRKMSQFELKILVHDPYISPERVTQAGAEPASFERVLAESDFVSVHVPLKPDTRHLIGEQALRSMQPHAVLINTARGPVVDEVALIRGLTEGWIGGAGLDVCEQEPIAKDNPLLKLDNVVLTPHTAGYSDIFYDCFWRYSVETVLAIANGFWPRSPLNRRQITPRWPLADTEWPAEPRRYAP